MKKFFLKSAALAIFTLLPMGMNAQITYSSGNLNINNAPKHNYLGLTVNKWLGMYWTCKTNNFFQLDISPANPRLAGTGNQVVFYNSATSTFNSIQVANVYNYSDARAKDNIKPLTKPFGSFWRIVCSITRGPAKPISAPGSARIMSPSIAKLAVTPPVVGSVRTLT